MRFQDAPLFLKTSLALVMELLTGNLISEHQRVIGLGEDWPLRFCRSMNIKQMSPLTTTAEQSYCRTKPLVHRTWGKKKETDRGPTFYSLTYLPHHHYPKELP